MSSNPRKFWLLLGSAVAVVWSLLPPADGESKSAGKARVLSTTSVTGEVVPCG